MAVITIVDDDIAMNMLAETLSHRGHETQRVGCASEAIQQLDTLLRSDLIVLDIIMPHPPDGIKGELPGDRTAGVQILREIRSHRPDVPVIVLSATQDPLIINAIDDDPHTQFLSKWGGPSLKELVQKVHQLLEIELQPEKVAPFIVHGHDDTTKLELKNYLQNTLHLPEPTVLHEQPSLGRTLIEKFEDCAARSTLVFVLLTPDDRAANEDDADALKRRARQNVIFELGYFLGILGRRSGRVLLLHKGALELPSDLSGVVYIDISYGIEAAGEQLRVEIDNAIK